jgi:hypothetical protein
MNALEDFFDLKGETILSMFKNNYIEAFKRIGKRNKPQEAPKKWIQFKDKAFSLNSKQIYKVESNYFFTNPIPWEIGESPDTPIIDRLFTDWVGEENKQILYEIIAYCCIADYPIQLLFCLVGCGRNGKTTLLGSSVKMSDGKWKKVEDIKIGDEVISPQEDGTFVYAKVKHIHSRFEPDIYEVREENRKHRLLYTCAGNHDIPFYRKTTEELPPVNGKRRRKGFRMLDCREAQEIAKYSHKNKKSSYTSFTTTAIEYKREDSTIDPYCFGA